MAKKTSGGSSKKGIPIIVAIFLLLVLISIIRQKPAVGIILLIVVAAAVACFIFLNTKKKRTENSTGKEAGAVKSSTSSTPVSAIKTAVKKNIKGTSYAETPDSEKDFDYMPPYNEKSVLRYQYEHDLYIPEDINVELLRGNGGNFLELKPEPENEYDDKAVAVYLKDAKIGYIFKGQTQDMIHDWLKRKEPINVYLNKFSIAERRATYKIGFYKLLNNCESKTFPITRITKKADDEWSNSRLEALSQTEIGEVLTVDEEMGGGYYLINDGFDEIGSLSKSGVKYIEENEPFKAVGVLAEKDIEYGYNYDPESGSAKVTIYLVK